MFSVSVRIRFRYHMLLLKYVFVILHILTAASWFGLAPADRPARAALSRGAGPERSSWRRRARGAWT